MDWETLLIVTHIIGTTLGVGGATFAEVFYLKAIRDGVVSPVEGDFLKTTYAIMRTGLVLLVLSGFGFLLLYRLNGAEALLLNGALWAKLTIVLVLVANAVMIQIRKMPMWLATSLSLTSWYAALVLGAWRGIPYSFLEILIGYVVAVFAVAYILETIKKAYVKK
ncbi:MAG: hypothetical protein BMS9Abin13_370 [Patescibacteria group bacterium]|nr:MAG: hypothetical protein BMS9Abin13_370 [Patescibacteria group bacterium]